ncbi:MAG: ankyrin repeat domain-containing protein [bacterium]|nr:ankyrin repeat domain-containing protein [bacterium]
MIALWIIGAFFASAQALGAKPIQLTKSNFKRATSEKPVIAFVYFPCGIGENLLNYAFADVPGVNTAALDSTKARPFSHRDYTLDTVFLIHKGKILAHKKRDRQGDNIGTNYLRSWAYRELKRAGLPVEMKRPESLLVEPEREPAGPVDLKRGLSGFFDFDSGRPVNSASGAAGRFLLQSDSGNFQIRDGVLRGDGDYFNGGKLARNAKFFAPSSAHKKMRTNGFTVHLNVRPLAITKNSSDPERSFSMSLFDGQAQLVVRRGRLLLDLISDRKHGAGYWSAKEPVFLTDRKIQFGEWQGIVLRFDFRRKRIAVLHNGRRLRDVNMSDHWIELVNHKVVFPVNFYYGRAGVLLNGDVDNLAIYERPLSALEMTALYKKYKRDAGDTEIDPQPAIDVAAANRRMLSAAYDGDLKQVRSALDAGANVNAKSRGWTALMFAAHFGRLPLAKLLADRGADPHIQKDGWNAQELAEFKGHTRLAKFIAGELRNERHCDCQLGRPEYKVRDLGLPTKP